MKLGSILNVTLFTISLGKLEFRPALIPSLVTLVLLYILISLGQWQLGRAALKDDIQNKINTRTGLEAVSLASISTHTEEQQFLPVNATGTYDNEHQVILDNQVLNHRAGYDVYTPFIRESGPAILVNRGWIPLGRTRQDIPDIRIESLNTQISGLLAKAPSRGLVLAENVNRFSEWPAVVQFVDLDEIQASLGYSLYPMILILDQSHASALQRKPLSLAMNSDKHRAYAFQWFGLATALFIIYVVVNTKRGTGKND